MQFSYFQGGIKNTSKSNLVDIPRALQIIQSDQHKETVERIRSLTDESAKKVLKSTLAYFTFSGQFNARKLEGLVKHSGFICVDFDHLQQLDYIKEKLVTDPYTHMLFVSPGGEGLKIVVKIDPEEHLNSFFWLEGYYDRTYGLKLDPSCKDIPRPCFVSYDPDCFYNADSQTPAIPKDVDLETGEVLESPKVPESKGKLIKLVEAYVKKIEDTKTDITAEYSDWLVVCFCLATFGEEGRDYFHRVSKLNEKYSLSDCNYKFDNAIKTSRFTTPAKFFTICKSYNLKIKAIKIVAAARAEGADIDENSEWQYMDMRFKSLMDLDDVQKKSVRQYRMAEVNNRYYHASKYDEKSMIISMEPFSNFIIRPLFLIKSKTDPKRIIEIENEDGEKITLDVPTDAFTSLAEFNKFIEGQGNFLFTVKAPPFTLLKIKIYKQTREAEEVKVLGWHKDGAYIFANGGFKHGKFYPTDDYGILTLPRKADSDDEEDQKVKRYFLPAMSDIYKDADDTYEDEKKFVYIRRPDVTFEGWAKQFHLVHKDNGMIGMLHYISALYSDFIFSKYRWFPHLFLFGVPQSGKSTLGWSLSYMFGQAQTPYNLNQGTIVALARKFANFRNSMVWCDEFNNNEIDDKKYQLLKGAYDRAGHQKGEMKSERNTSTPVRSCGIISGQNLPMRDNAALFTRCNLLQFLKGTHTQEEADNLKVLQTMEQKGLSHITAPLMLFREKVENEFEATFEGTMKEFNPLLSEVSTRMVQNIVVLAAMYKITADRLKYPFGYEELKKFIIKNAKDQHRLIATSKETSVFWDLVMFMLAQNMIKDKEDFKVQHLNSVRVSENGQMVEKQFAETTAVLYLRLSKAHPLYLKLHREQHNKIGMDRNSLLHYLTSLPSYIGSNDKIRFDTHVTNAYLFNHDMLAKEGYDFLRDPDTGEGDGSKEPSSPPAPPNDGQSGEKAEVGSYPPPSNDEKAKDVAVDKTPQSDDDCPF
jgi:hypothetical protein